MHYALWGGDTVRHPPHIQQQRPHLCDSWFGGPSQTAQRLDKWSFHCPAGLGLWLHSYLNRPLNVHQVYISCEVR